MYNKNKIIKYNNLIKKNVNSNDKKKLITPFKSDENSSNINSSSNINNNKNSNNINNNNYSYSKNNISNFSNITQDNKQTSSQKKIYMKTLSELIDDGEDDNNISIEHNSIDKNNNDNNNIILTPIKKSNKTKSNNNKKNLLFSNDLIEDKIMHIKLDDYKSTTTKITIPKFLNDPDKFLTIDYEENILEQYNLNVTESDIKNKLKKSKSASFINFNAIKDIKDITYNNYIKIDTFKDDDLKIAYLDNSNSEL